MAQISIFVGTVFGNSESVADAMKEQIIKENHVVEVFTSGTIEDINQSENLLICTSTTGSGDIPDELAILFYELKEKFPLMSDKTYAVVGLGDSSYGITFCRAGSQFDDLLEELTAKRVTEMLRIDAMETFEPEKDALNWLQTYLDAFEGIKV